MADGRFRQLLKKYGKTALGVHFSISATSITGLYVAIKNNVDVESMLERVGMRGVPTSPDQEKSTIQQFPQPNPEMTDEFIREEPALDQETDKGTMTKKRNRTAELAASSGGALALAVLLNKAMLPVRVPITIALTPPLARFLARRRFIKNSV